MTDRGVLVSEVPSPEPEPVSPPAAPGRGSRWRSRRWRWRASGALVVVVLAVVLVASHLFVSAGSATGQQALPAAPRPPVLGPARDVYNGDLGDPFVLPVTAGGRVVSFVAFGTGDWPARVPTAYSTDLTTWHAGPDAMPQLPSWTAPDPKNSLSWAPAALATSHGYLLYVTLPDAKSGQQCIAVARSSRPEGPYVGVGGGPLVCQHDLGGSIDPSVVRDGSTLYLLWKNDGNSVGAPSVLWEQKLSPDGTRLVGPAHRLLGSNEAWQGGIVEEPAAVRASGGGWWLFYSGNAFDKAGYAIGVAFCPTPEGPCRDLGPDSLLGTAGLGEQGQYAPGGLETFRDGHGALWAVFDTWNRPPRNGIFYCCRSVQLAPITST